MLCQVLLVCTSTLRLSLYSPAVRRFAPYAGHSIFGFVLRLRLALSSNSTMAEGVGFEPTRPLQV